MRRESFPNTCKLEAIRWILEWIVINSSSPWHAALEIARNATRVPLPLTRARTRPTICLRGRGGGVFSPWLVHSAAFPLRT